MLIVRGVNVFPTALRDLVGGFAPETSGVLSVRPSRKGFRQDPPLRILVECGEGEREAPDLADQIQKAIRDKLLVTTRIEMVPFNSLPRSDYKSKLVDWSDAS